MVNGIDATPPFPSLAVTVTLMDPSTPGVTEIVLPLRETPDETLYIRLSPFASLKAVLGKVYEKGIPTSACWLEIPSLTTGGRFWALV